ncbi:DNA-3-methyladenine glycosylase [Lacticaseibacillus mingshuiensis]|uniref:Putative 3-methyladenine DNA glycosylase n=2 Tax=Lacticaseibacillus mingshuiensis TaxID=2799574 RepID=A0ABW4CCZ7_9LACO|nr:DNA-3-methyladenine glycosylase [Lacticaseibacillus mingshuiensis]
MIEIVKMTVEDQLQNQPTITSARDLLGCVLTVGACSGLIVETEAYLGEGDRAAHAFGGRRTPRNSALYDAAGTVYVYQMRQYCLLKLVTQAKAVPQCVLIRALEPLTGLALMAQRRGVSGPALTNGPGKLCQALALTRADNATLLNRNRLCLSLMPARLPQTIGVAPRIGVPNKGEATTAPLRFFVQGNQYVSDMKRALVDQRGGWQ